MVAIAIRLNDEEHKILSEKAEKARQSINQYILSRVLDEKPSDEQIKKIMDYLGQNNDRLQKVVNNGISGIEGILEEPKRDLVSMIPYLSGAIYY